MIDKEGAPGVLDFGIVTGAIFLNHQVRMKEQSGIYRKGFGLKEQISANLTKNFQSRFVTYLRAHGNEIHLGEVSIFLAREFGFCYGVDRAVELAYETCRQFPQQRIFLLGEIIHNPFVNSQLRKIGVMVLNVSVEGRTDFTFIQPQDVVILPAFGVPYATVQQLRQRGCMIVDTTCGSVLTVWKRIEKYVQDGFTVLIHGRYQHEETRATCSHVTKHPHGKYLVIYDRTEALLVRDFIAGRLTSAELLQKLGGHTSAGFDPEVDLQRIGLANQTTMLSSESLEIARMIADALKDRYGAEELSSHFCSFDTICSATQDRQDAVMELLQNRKPELMLVIGGYNSSNTSHLVEIAAQRVPTYHIEGVEALRSREEIEHRFATDAKIGVTRDWLSSGKITVGLTAGASTPNSTIGQVLYRLLELKDVPATTIDQLLTLAD